METNLLHKYKITSLIVFFIILLSWTNMPAQSREIGIERLRKDFCASIDKCMNKSILEKLTISKSLARVDYLSNWEGVAYSCKVELPDGLLRLRGETPFFNVAFDSKVLFAEVNDDPLQVIQDVSRSLLSGPCALGSVKEIRFSGENKPDANYEIALAPSKVLVDQSAVFYGGYTILNPRRAGTHVAYIVVLVKGTQAVVVLGRDNAAVQLGAGLKTAELDALKGEPIKKRTQNTVFKSNKIQGIHRYLINACIWPVEDKGITGAKDLGGITDLIKEYIKKDKD